MPKLILSNFKSQKVTSEKLKAYAATNRPFVSISIEFCWFSWIFSKCKVQNSPKTKVSQKNELLNSSNKWGPFSTAFQNLKRDWSRARQIFWIISLIWLFWAWQSHVLQNRPIMLKLSCRGNNTRIQYWQMLIKWPIQNRWIHFSWKVAVPVDKVVLIVKHQNFACRWQQMQNRVFRTINFKWCAEEAKMPC